MSVQSLAAWLVDTLVYIANGGLVIGYALCDHAAQLAAIGAALVIALSFDRLVQREAVFAPARQAGGRPAERPAPRTAQALTGIALGLWLAATWAMGAPVPVIGAVMWWTGALILLIMPQQRWALLWTLKGYLILYSLAILGFRLLLWQAAALSPAQLAELLGGRQTAGQILAQNTATLATLGVWLLWVIVPVGYFAVFLQNLLAQPLALVGPRQSAQEIITLLRTRSGGAR